MHTTTDTALATVTPICRGHQGADLPGSCALCGDHRDPAWGTFQVGQTYDTGRGADYVWTFTVVKRTAKFITIRDHLDGSLRRVGVKVGHKGAEFALPLGTYSLAPVITADRPAA